MHGQGLQEGCSSLLRLYADPPRRLTLIRLSPCSLKLSSCMGRIGIETTSMWNDDWIPPIPLFTLIGSEEGEKKKVLISI